MTAVPGSAGDMFDAVMNYTWRDLVIKTIATKEIGLRGIHGRAENTV